MLSNPSIERLLMSEKRYEQRRKRRFAIRFGTDSPTRLAFTEDVSKGGIFIKTTNVYPPGSQLQVTILLPDEQMIVMEGKVQWARRVPPQMLRLITKAGLGFKIERFIEGEDLFRSICEKTLTKA